MVVVVVVVVGGSSLREFALCNYRIPCTGACGGWSEHAPMAALAPGSAGLHRAGPGKVQDQWISIGISQEKSLLFEQKWVIPYTKITETYQKKYHMV